MNVTEGAWMHPVKLFCWHFMAYPYLPEDFDEKYFLAARSSRASSTQRRDAIARLATRVCRLWQTFRTAPDAGKSLPCRELIC